MPYFHAVFAYHSDLAQDGWLRAEHARLLDASKRLGVAASAIDRIYVAQRGLIHPERTRGIAEDDANGVGLMNLFAHVLNFVVRENGNRKAAPYGQYLAVWLRAGRRLARRALRPACSRRRPSGQLAAAAEAEALARSG